MGSGALPELAAEDGSRRPYAAHAVDAAAGRGRRRAEVDAAARASVRVEPRDRPGEELARVLQAAVDVAADVVRVVGLDLRRRRTCAGEDRGRGSRARSARPGPRSASLMSTVEPWGRGSTPSRCAGRPGARVGSNRLGWTTRTNGRSGCRPRVDLGLGGGDLVQRAADVDGAGASARSAAATGSARRAPSRP